MYTIKMDSVPRKCQNGLFLTCGDCLVPDVGDVFSRIATDEDFFRVTEVPSFRNKLMYYRASYRTQLLVVGLTHVWSKCFKICVHTSTSKVTIACMPVIDDVSTNWQQSGPLAPCLVRLGRLIFCWRMVSDSLRAISEFEQESSLGL